MQKIEMQLEQLTCPTCTKKIETALARTPGVLSAAISFNSSKAKVEIDESAVDVQHLQKIVTRLGYTVLSIKEKQG
ncbi:MAG: heavy-metal-associated domain-containing protein [Saccharofermentanales bacterium]